MDIYAICTYECIHVNTCERVIPGSRCVGVSVGVGVTESGLG